MTREIALHCMKSYSELHSDLCELCPIYGQTGSDHCFEDALQYVIGMLEQEPRWIPISEKLPNSEYGESDSVLVCFENETQDVLYFDGSNWCYPTGEIYISVNHKNGWHNKVVAWMPLPQSYRKVEE